MLKKEQPNQRLKRNCYEMVLLKVCSAVVLGVKLKSFDEP